MSIQGKEVLIIDDDRDMRLLLRKIFEAPGMTVTESANLSDAIKKLEAHKPHLITLDMKLGRDFGMKLLEYVNAHDSLKKIPILVISSAGEKKMIFQALSLGAKDYIVKPIVSHVLIKKIRKILRDRTTDVYEFEPGEQKLTASVDAELDRISEFAFQVEAPVKFEDSSNVRVSGEFFEEVKQTDINLRVNNRSKVSNNSHYKTEVVFKGLSKNSIRLIRRLRR